ncbi:MAG TPA: hypothetical protein VM282_04045 [Acidimicrobiales bacterium]|nr:hypothetical protein [Acidimicrobiales bacterium]
MSTKHSTVTEAPAPLPEWLNLDALISPADRARIEECGQAAHKALDALLEFVDEWGRFYTKVDRATWDTPFNEIEGVYDSIRAHVGLPMVDGPLKLIGAVIALVSGEKPGDDFGYLVDSSTTPSQERILRALYQLRYNAEVPYGGGDGRGAAPEEGGF